MRTGIAQISLEDSKDKNLIKALKAAGELKDCDLIVLPEMLMGRRTDEHELYDMAEDVEDGVFASALKEAAFLNDADICACLWEESGSRKVYNTAVIYGSDGTLKAKYRKLHLFDALSVRESDIMQAGSELPPVFECKGVKCGLSICYDLRFPEVYRYLAIQGVELFIIPAAWYAGESKTEHLHTLLSARALENTCYSLCANLCGLSFAGSSAFYAPFGEQIASLEKGESFLVSDINLEYLQEVRRKLPCLDNFRRDIF